MKSRGELNTEKRNEVSTSIDSMSIKDILQTINDEDSKIINAVKNYKLLGPGGARPAERPRSRSHSGRTPASSI